MRRLTCTLLVCVLSLQPCSLALAEETADSTDAPKSPLMRMQEERAQEEQKQQDEAPMEMTPGLIQCQDGGKMAGKAASTGGSFVGGFAGGVLLGLIGTGIAVAVQGAPDPPATELYQLEQADCRVFYSEAYKKALKGKKQKFALWGGLLGTAVIVTVLVMTADSE